MKKHRKIAIASLVHAVAMRLFQILSKICAQLIVYAISLDPTRKVFKDSLRKIPFKKGAVLFKNRDYSLYSVPEGVKKLSAKIKYLSKTGNLSLSLPQIINNDFTKYSLNPEKQLCSVKVPQAYLAEFENATIFATTDLILVEDIALYDEMAFEKSYTYVIKSPSIASSADSKITVRIPKSAVKTIKCGIHFTKDHSANYFHWLIECLPRLGLIGNIDKDVPLLIDDNLPHQSIEALELLNTENRKFIHLKQDEYYNVEKLYYPSGLSVVHDSQDSPNYSKDVVYSPEAINYIRKSVLDALNIKPEKGFRKLYLSRKNVTRRQLLNTNEIEDILASRGFEILFPENLSFASQVQIFSQSSVIIGQSGAGMANFIFAPADCQVLMMMSDTAETNLQLFQMIADITRLKIEFIIGKTAYSLPKPYSPQVDFYVDTKYILEYIDNLKL